MQYFTPDGKSINGKGITPDITVRQNSGGTDAQLAKAVEILE